MKPKIKILLIRFSSIGDIVLTTPVIRTLKKHFGNTVELHYLTKKAFVPVLQANPYLTKIHSFDKHIKEITPELKNEHFDHLIDLHKNIRSQAVINRLQVPALRFNKLNYEKWLLVNFKINRLPNQHIVDRYMEPLSVFDIKNDNEGLDYFIPENDTIDIAQTFDVKSGSYIAFVIGAAHYTKKFPKEKIVAVCRLLAEKSQLPVILIGGKNDTDEAQYITQHTGNTINACGKFNINQSASIIKQAQAVITNDTGMMHIASAFQKPIVTIWGNTVPEFGMYPYQPKNPENVVIIENRDIKCRPCSKIGFSKCPKKHFNCMLWDNEQLIVSNLLRFIDN